MTCLVGADTPAALRRDVDVSEKKGSFAVASPHPACAPTVHMHAAQPQDLISNPHSAHSRLRTQGSNSGGGSDEAAEASRVSPPPPIPPAQTHFLHSTLP